MLTQILCQICRLNFFMIIKIFIVFTRVFVIQILFVHYEVKFKKLLIFRPFIFQNNNFFRLFKLFRRNEWYPRILVSRSRISWIKYKITSNSLWYVARSQICLSNPCRKYVCLVFVCVMQTFWNTNIKIEERYGPCKLYDVILLVLFINFFIK